MEFKNKIDLFILSKLATVLATKNKKALNIGV